MAISAKIALARLTFHAVLDQLRSGEDEVGVFAFDAALQERHPFTRDLDRVRRVLDDLRAFGNTSLYDAVERAAKRLGERPTTHKALLLLTDGTDTSSVRTPAQVSSLANSVGVPVYVVTTVPGIDQRRMAEDRDVKADAADLRDLAAWSAGELAFVSDRREIDALAPRLVQTLREQYVLGIEAGPGPQWRRVEVRVKNPQAVVRARTWYRGG